MMVDVNGEAWETAWDVGNVIYDGIRGVYYEVKGNRKKANEAWTDLGYDLGAALIPFVPAGLSKLKYADEVADGLNKIDDVFDATKKLKSIPKDFRCRRS